MSSRKNSCNTPGRWLGEAVRLCAGLALCTGSTERFHCDEDMGEFYKQSMNRSFLSLTTGGKGREKKTLSKGNAPKSCLDAAQPHWCSEAKRRTVIKNVYTDHPFRFSISCRPCADRRSGTGHGTKVLQPRKPGSKSAEALFFPWENCRLLFFGWVFFFSFAPLPFSSRSVKAAVGDRMPDQMEQRVLANPPFVTNK